MRQPNAPALMAGNTLSSVAKLVRTKIYTWGCCALIWHVASIPSSTGMTRSINTKSGCKRTTPATQRNVQQGEKVQLKMKEGRDENQRGLKGQVKMGAQQ
jgi:hypothetical protein